MNDTRYACGEAICLILAMEIQSHFPTASRSLELRNGGTELLAIHWHRQYPFMQGVHC
jgi:hypothetical protein